MLSTETDRLSLVESHSVRDWLELHGFEVSTVRTVLARLKSNSSATAEGADTQAVSKLQLDAEEAWRLAAQALAACVPELSVEIFRIRDSCEKIFHVVVTDRPYTLDRGESQVPFVSMCYRGTPTDVVCVSHEFGHALQYHLAQGRFILPLLREFTAFMAERALLEFVQRHRPTLYMPLYEAWQSDNGIYLGDDVEKLEIALGSLNSLYSYRLNYPLARVLSDAMFSGVRKPDYVDIFRGNVPLSRLLSLMQIRSVNEKRENYLPEIPETEDDGPALNAYRSLGVMVLLDIDDSLGESEKTVEEYYSLRLFHLKNQTAFIAISNERKPIGYAIWEAVGDESSMLHLKWQSAPFGNNLELQKQLQARLPENTQVLANPSWGV